MVLRLLFIKTKKKARYKFMKEFWNVIQMVFTAVGGWL